LGLSKNPVAVKGSAWKMFRGSEQILERRCNWQYKIEEFDPLPQGEPPCKPVREKRGGSVKLWQRSEASKWLKGSLLGKYVIQKGEGFDFWEAGSDEKGCEGSLRSKNCTNQLIKKRGYGVFRRD